MEGSDKAFVIIVCVFIAGVTLSSIFGKGEDKPCKCGQKCCVVEEKK